MKKIIRVLTASLLIAAPFGLQAQGGFQGPNESITTVASLDSLSIVSDDQPVTLAGHIKSQVKGNHYRFADATGEIVLEIDEDAWGTLQVTPDMQVILIGEAEKTVTGIEVEIDQVRQAKP